MAQNFNTRCIKASDELCQRPNQSSAVINSEERPCKASLPDSSRPAERSLAYIVVKHGYEHEHSQCFMHSNPA